MERSPNFDPDVGHSTLGRGINFGSPEQVAAKSVQNAANANQDPQAAAEANAAKASQDALNQQSQQTDFS